MKIGYILTTFPCQSELFAVREIEGLCKLGFDITVFAAVSQTLFAAPFRDVTVVYRPPIFSIRSFVAISYIIVRYPLGLVRLTVLILKLFLSNSTEAKLVVKNIHTVAFFTMILDSKKIRHIHAYFLNWPACMAMAITVVTRRTFSIATHARDLFVERGAMRLKISKAHFVVTCTQYGLDYLKRRLSIHCHDKLHVNYHGINFDLNPNTEDNCKADKFNGHRLIAIGRLIPKKGFDYLIKAFSLLHQSHQDCNLLIVGEGPEYQRLAALVGSMNLGNNVSFLRWLEHNSTRQLICNSAILIVPSVIASDGDRDGIPNVILEAFGAGTVVIATDLIGIREVVIHNETGLLVRQRDVSELVLSIEQLLGDENLRKRLSRNAHKMAIRQFDSMRNVKELAKLFMGKN